MRPFQRSKRRAERIEGIRGRITPLSTVEAGNGFADLAPLRATIGDARIVALGEATHGSREFFQLKHRLVEFLVVELGFRVFIIEANWPEALAVNDYVLHGLGDPAQALAGLYFWTWDTEEVLAMIRWMRAYNTDRAEADKVHFAGMDAQFPKTAAAAVATFLSQVDAGYAADATPRLTQLGGAEPIWGRALTAEETDRFAIAHEVLARLDADEERYTEATSANAWRFARQHANVLCQIVAQQHVPDAPSRYTIRDTAMADNVVWTLDSHPAGTKAVLWAHNGHVTRDNRGLFDPSIIAAGQQLAGRYPDDLVVIGFAFGQGAFQVRIAEGYQGVGDAPPPVGAFTVGAMPSDTLDATLAAVAEASGCPAFVLDLRSLDGELATWFNRPRRTREAGSVVMRERDMWREVVPAASYDILAFVGETTRARPTPTGVRQ